MKKELKGLAEVINVEADDNILQNLGSAPSKQEVTFDEVLKHFLSPNDIDTKSRIKPKQVLPLAKLMIYDEVFKVPLAGELAKKILRLSISDSGSGRKELIEIVRGMPSNVDGPFNPLELKSTLFGGK